MAGYRPQFVYPPPPPGYVDEEFTYYFDNLNTPGLGNAPIQKIPLKMQPDAEYRLRGIEMSGNQANLTIRFWTPDGYQMSQVPVLVTDAYQGREGAPPIGSLPVALECEIVCPAGSQFLVDLDFL